MKPYENKQKLIDTIQMRYQKYIAEFKDIPEELKNQRVEGVDKTPSENLSYQLGWVNLLLKWEKEEQQGKEVQMPAEGYKWNRLGGLYDSFYEKYGKYSLEEQMNMLDDAINQLFAWINSLTEKEVFEPNQRKWATSNAQWPVYKWVHINTVAPFTSFRTKIRKWKRASL